MIVNLSQRKDLCLILLDNSMSFEVIDKRIYVEGSKLYIQKMLPKDYSLVKVERCCWEVVNKISKG